MKICLLGDTHFSCRNDSLDFHNYFKEFFSEIFFPYIINNNIDTIFQFGDIFDKRKYINFNSLYLSKSYFFDKLTEYNIKLYTLLGNHDIFFKESLIVNSPHLLLQSYDNITIFDKFTTIELNNINIDIVPWICNENREEILNNINNSNSSLCFGHFELAGFEFDPGNISKAGLDKSILTKYDTVYSGHFHHKSKQNNIQYLGTPVELTWADYNDPKGFYILDLSTLETEFIKNTINIFHKIIYDDLDKSLDYWETFDCSKYTNCYIKIIVINKTNPYIFDKLIDVLYKNNPLDISIIEDFSDIDNNDDTDVIDQNKDTLSLLFDYIDTQELVIDNNRMKTLIQEVYIEALNSNIIGGN